MIIMQIEHFLPSLSIHLHSLQEVLFQDSPIAYSFPASSEQGPIPGQIYIIPTLNSFTSSGYDHKSQHYLSMNVPIFIYGKDSK